ncbi:hypothetical protein BKA93DRAFT_826827 [Sparassis latifolia]
MDAFFTIAAPVPDEVEAPIALPADFDTSGSGSGDAVRINTGLTFVCDSNAVAFALRTHLAPVPITASSSSTMDAFFTIAAPIPEEIETPVAIPADFDTSGGGGSNGSGTSSGCSIA